MFENFNILKILNLFPFMRDQHYYICVTYWCPQLIYIKIKLYILRKNKVKVVLMVMFFFGKYTNGNVLS